MESIHLERELEKPVFKCNDFLDELEQAIRETVDSKGYARRRDVRLRLWQQFRLGREATSFMLSLLASMGKVSMILTPARKMQSASSTSG